MMNFNSWENMMSWGGRPWMGAGFGLLAIWSLIWSGMALWKSARNGDRYWFLALLLIHTAGILDILYLFVFAKNKLVLVSEPGSAKDRSALGGKKSSKK
ncbi:MAG: hypothetical protein ACD_40C00072G0003 [uncultured bacterium]|nr:MAG: hypothetical protein ACD_40C00072G0003 [uncultured bacterium]